MHNKCDGSGGGFASHLIFVSIGNSIAKIWASLTFPSPNNVGNLIQQDSINLIEMCNMAIETIPIKSLLGLHVLVAMNLSNRDMLSATTSRDKLKWSATLYSRRMRRQGANEGKYPWNDGASRESREYAPTKRCRLAGLDPQPAHDLVRAKTLEQNGDNHESLPLS